MNACCFKVFFILTTQNTWIVLNSLLMQKWIFEFHEIQVQISKAAVRLSPPNANVLLFACLQSSCMGTAYLCSVTWVVFRNRWLFSQRQSKNLTNMPPGKCYALSVSLKYMLLEVSFLFIFFHLANMKINIIYHRRKGS